ncbi:FGGY-family carbohydrate kinase [Pelagibius sp. Alg239-R121]|uniref:xylulokinase n=1 Tax=Pelagibius sp. Alg239-R121 TaxID=2993448 RepID=UPI0024A6BAF3|nr:FGGY-family carbohydrate kinase [Pelagibius sp. Alg239-R121]
MSSSSEKLVIGLDSSTQSTKAIAWNAAGEAVAEGRALIPLSNPRLDCFEQDPLDWWTACSEALNACVAQVGPERIDAVAISNQRETIAFLDDRGEATYPAITWLDERARVQVESFSESFGPERIHRITGRPVDITPCLYRLLWMKENEPEVYARTSNFVDVQSYLVQRLAGGPFKTGWISADPMGLFDMEGKCWSQELLAALAIDASQLPEACPPGAELGRVTSEAETETGLKAGTPIFAAGGDGQCAGLGTNCVQPDRAYINLGTAVVSGVWSPDYRTGPAWRTEIAAQGDGYILENCLRSGTFLVDWFVDRFMPGGRSDPEVFTRLEAEALEVPIGSNGLLIQPYWSGVMDPYWDISARGAILGLGGSHGAAHIYRAILEAITIDQVMRTGETETALGHPISHYVAIGGGAASPLWRQMLADASGKQVLISDTVEASALGAGMIAAFGAGWYPSIVAAAAAMSGRTQAIEPDAGKGERYRALLEIYRDLYQATSSINKRLVRFAAEGTPA